MKHARHAATSLAAAMVLVLGGVGGLHGEPAPERGSPASPGRKAPAMESIRIRLAGETVTATLESGEAARAFRALLPLTLNLTDYNATEKIGDLPGKLSIQGEPTGIDPEPGDITYYAPWGNLAIFYKDFGYSRGLVRLGRLSRIPDAFRRPGPITVTIEPAP